MQLHTYLTKCVLIKIENDLEHARAASPERGTLARKHANWLADFEAKLRACMPPLSHHSHT